MSGVIGASTLAAIGATSTFGAIATGVSVIGGIASAASSLGVFGGGQKSPTMPAIVAPAQAATTNRNDTGGQVVVGADAVKNQRVSGNATAGGTQARSTSTTDILGGLGAGGINI